MKSSQRNAYKGISARRRVASAFVVVTALGLALVGATSANAAKPASRVAAPSPMAGGISSGVCKMAWQTALNNLHPPAGNSGPVSAAIIAMNKSCPGTVVGTFSAEVYTPGVGDWLQIRMLAVCLGAGGQPNPCLTGEAHYAEPGATYFQRVRQPDAEANSFTQVWPNLKRGTWKFIVELSGDGATAQVAFRTFTLEAFSP